MATAYYSTVFQQPADAAFGPDENLRRLVPLAAH